MAKEHLEEKKHLEIERRWLLKSLPGPEILGHESTTFIHYTAVYIFRDENLEVRVQKRVDHRGPHRVSRPRIKFPLVTKLGRGMIRQESPKLQADEKTYERYFCSIPLLPCLPMNLWELSLSNGQRWEIKTVDWTNASPGLGFGQFNNVILAEMEFQDEESARAFGTDDFPLWDFPTWLKPLVIREVTDDPRYEMGGLATHGRPDSE